MAVTPAIPGYSKVVWSAGVGPICHIKQRASVPVLCMDTSEGGGGSRCPSKSLASGPSLRFSASSPATVCAGTDTPAQSNGNTGGPQVARPALVPRDSPVSNQSSVDATDTAGLTPAGSDHTSKSRNLSTDSLEIERELLISQGYLDQVVATLLASRCQSTKKAYGAMWKIFTKWAASKGVSPTRVRVRHVLSFLQLGLEKGLATNTLRRQLAAISGILGAGL